MAITTIKLSEVARRAEELNAKPTGVIASATKTSDVTGPGRITLTPTWEEVATIYTRYAVGGERKACAGLAPEIIRACRMADILNALMHELPAEKVQEIHDRIKG